MIDALNQLVLLLIMDNIHTYVFLSLTDLANGLNTIDIIFAHETAKNLPPRFILQCLMVNTETKHNFPVKNLTSG